MEKRSNTKSNYEALALVLLVSGLAGFFLFLWQIIYIPKHLVGYLSLTFSIFDFYLAYAFFKIKFKVKKILFLRIFLGLLGWFIVFYFLEAQYGLIWAKIGFLAILAIIGTAKIKKASLLAILAIIFIFINSYSTIYYITYQQKLLISLKKYGISNYTSKEYNYKISTPSNWKIITRKKFSKIKEQFLETKAEMALFTKDGNSFCLIIPNKLDGLGRNYNLTKIKKRLIDNFKMRKTVKINKVAPFISSEKGFQIQYTDIIEGVRQDYIIIYLNKGNFDLKFIGWTLGNKQEKIYKELQTIAKNTLIKKN
ncbi:MAG: hypothetical protein K9L80_01580 [Candidatus Omnitrophica bacterium]|nr:hypothetical protein [Candidatus Omnitrophota bacterium]MCF7888050.1 hypothetical protein [Candidatus Omnitrophota bacterium]